MNIEDIDKMYRDVNRMMEPFKANEAIAEAARQAAQFNYITSASEIAAKVAIDASRNLYAQSVMEMAWSNIYSREVSDFSLRLADLAKATNTIGNLGLNTEVGRLVAMFADVNRYSHAFRTLELLEQQNSYAVNVVRQLEDMASFNSFRFKEYLLNVYTDKEANDQESSQQEKSENSLIIVDDSHRLKRIILDVYKDNSILYTLEPRAFEEMIAELLDDRGFKVKLTKKTKDDGYDILCIDYSNKLFESKFLVECKRYSENRKVGVEIVRSFKEVIATEKANKGIIVTSSYFTSGAIKKKDENPWLLDLRDKDGVIDWVKSYGKI
ncbi:MAG: restriction endonuclease [Bacteroidetes bacterium]|nr:restriction endonuclease [Bacteroidota bacterium]